MFVFSKRLIVFIVSIISMPSLIHSKFPYYDLNIILHILGNFNTLCHLYLIFISILSFESYIFERFLKKLITFLKLLTFFQITHAKIFHRYFYAFPFSSQIVYHFQFVCFLTYMFFQFFTKKIVCSSTHNLFNFFKW